MISVIVPLYNCEKYIFQCVTSVLEQTYGEFELIVINDGSTDNSLQILTNLNDSRIKVYSQKNKGLLHARLEGLRHATGESCVFLDADDVLANDALNQIRAYFALGFDCIMYNLAVFSDNDIAKVKKNKPVFENGHVFSSDDKKNLLAILFSSGCLNSIVCKAFKKNLIDIDSMVSFPRIAIGEDALFTMQVFTNYNKAIYLDQALYLYRQQAQSMTHKAKYSIYSDNVFKLQLYKSTIPSFFNKNESLVLEKKVDSLLMKTVASLAINDRFIYDDYFSYSLLFKQIAGDAYFKETFKHAEKDFFYFVSSLIMHGQYRLAYFLKTLRRVLWFL